MADGRSSGEGDLSGVYELLVTGPAVSSYVPLDLKNSKLWGSTLRIGGRVSALHPHHPVRMRPGSGILRGVGTEEPWKHQKRLRSGCLRCEQDVPDLRVSPFHSAYKEALGC